MYLVEKLVRVSKDACSNCVSEHEMPSKVHPRQQQHIKKDSTKTNITCTEKPYTLASNLFISTKALISSRTQIMFPCFSILYYHRTIKDSLVQLKMSKQENKSTQV